MEREAPMNLQFGHWCLDPLFGMLMLKMLEIIYIRVPSRRLDFNPSRCQKLYFPSLSTDPRERFRPATRLVVERQMCQTQLAMQYGRL